MTRVGGRAADAGGVRPPRNKGKRRALVVIVSIGIALAVLGLLALAANLLFFSRIQLLEPWQTDVTVAGGFLGLSSSEIDQLSFFVAVPGGLFLLAMCFITTGRVLRGRVGMRTTPGPDGGTVVSSNTYLSPRAQLTWIGVAVAFWILLIVVPVLSSLADGWPASVRELPQTYVWINLGMYGALASAVAGVLLVSHLKKQRYLVMVAAEDPRLLEAPSDVWRWLTFRWRFDLWIGALGGAAIGASVLALASGNVALFVIPFLGGLVLTVVGVWMARQYWRAGVPLGVAESFA